MTQQSNGVFATAGAVLASVTTAANAVTKTLGGLNDMADVVTLHSSKYLNETRIRLAAEAVQSEKIIIEETTHRMANRLAEIKKQLDADTTLTELYNEIRPSIQAAVDTALGRNAK